MDAVQYRSMGALQTPIGKALVSKQGKPKGKYMATIGQNFATLDTFEKGDEWVYDSVQFFVDGIDPGPYAD
jgi:hypothetical protein